MKRALVGALVALVLLPLAARAQDRDWNRTGFYVGLLGGYDATVLQTNGVDLGDGKLMAGAFAGFNARLTPDLVVGVEGDWLFTDVAGQTSNGITTLTSGSQHLASIRARVGFPMGPALLYVTGGPAITESHVGATNGILSIADKDWLIGAALGGGIEAEVSRTLFARLEAIHYMFPDNTVALGPDLFKTENQQTVIRVGLGFKLN